MGRQRTGCAQWNPAKGTWVALLTLDDGKRSPPIPMAGLPAHDGACPCTAKDPCAVRGVAMLEASRYAKRAKDAGAVSAATIETVREYADRWIADRTARGITTAATHDAGRLRRHVLPLIGSLDVRTFGREDVEKVVADLDRKSRLDADDDDDALWWKTASNVWVLLSRMCKDMTDAKNRALRVRDDNPAERVAPPDRGEARAKNYLYPSEFRRLVECQAIDVRFRIVYAVAVYTYARAGELVALEPSDIDLEHSVISITKSWDRATRKVKSTKTGTTRRIPIEPELHPLLAKLHAECEARTDEGPKRVLWLPDHEDRAVLLRQHLQQAEVTRAELFASDAQRKHVTFHDLRATGITWMAVRGDDPLRIKQRAGHKSFSTTEIYIREAENLRDGFGDPFPSLPSDLAGGYLPNIVISSGRPLKFPAKMVEQRGIEHNEAARPDGGKAPRKTPESRAKPTAQAERNVATPSVETLRAKLDAAIVAEAWDAVKAIRERIIEVERGTTRNVLRMPKRGAS